MAGLFATANGTHRINVGNEHLANANVKHVINFSRDFMFTYIYNRKQSILRVSIDFCKKAVGTLMGDNTRTIRKTQIAWTGAQKHCFLLRENYNLSL